MTVACGRRVIFQRYEAHLEKPHAGCWIGQTIIDGPACPIPLCSKRSHEGLILQPHIAYWLVWYDPDSDRRRWFCSEHLPWIYWDALVDEGLVLPRA
jgi:hypothetical protein